ncbi:MAG TPA: thioesterase family protein [Gemmatimonadales bacterium]|nr:thioesterase family protein [Gemmatimonadales bacterium]
MGGTGTLLTHRGVIYPWHCDHMGHMNVMWYVGKFDEATWHLMAALGLTPAYLRDSGTGMVAVEQTISYKQELMAGDLISVHSTVLEVRNSALRFTHEMRNETSGEVCATTLLVGVHLDTTIRKSRALPASVRGRAAELFTLTPSGAGA